MLKKLIAIRGVGAFKAYSASGDVSFRPFTAVWGPNGVGKSTICDILRSCSTGDAAPVLGRRSLTSSAGQEIDLLLSTGKHSFRNGSWEAGARPQFVIYDTCYVHDNVHVGEFVEHDQRRNLYRVIVGEQGVSLAGTVDALDGQHRDAVKEANARREAIRVQLPKGLDLEAYLAFQPEALIDAKIETKEKELSALEQAGAIAKRSPLSPVAIPTLPNDVDSLLATTLEGINAATEDAVRAHLANVNAREGWVSEGLRSKKGDLCPFCGQDVSRSALIDAFQRYFSESYGALKERIASRIRDIEASFGDASVQRLRTVVERNSELGAEWASLTGQPWEQRLTFEAIDDAREAVLYALRRKEAAPLEPVEPVMLLPAVARLQSLSGETSTYNGAVTTANALIDAVKGKVKVGKLDHAQRELALLRAQRDRFDPGRDDACTQLEAAIARREEIDAKKAAAKNKLDDHAAAILADYQVAINGSLKKFGANFRIMKLERRYSGGTPSSSYVLQIDNANVELGDRKTSRAEPSFRNTLSAGDRSALAFAFFLAQVDRDPVIGQKVVVFDDPFTSQDRSRRTHTQQEISRIHAKAAQVIVFSHDDSFLSDCCKRVSPGELKTLQIRRLMTGPTISEWDSAAPRSEVLQDHQRLKEFLVTGESDSTALRGVAKKIRLVLEAYLRGRFIAKFKDNEWLGDMIAMLRANQASLPEGSLLPDELACINEYSKQYHHSNPNAEHEAIDETELRTWVERTLAIADGF
jgi:wobble nucleotide-excising tRNase